jgi:hypothetical protein
MIGVSLRESETRLSRTVEAVDRQEVLDGIGSDIKAVCSEVLVV